MPRSKNPDIYGPEYEQLLLTLAKIGTLRLDMASESQCHTMRRKYYGYREAVRKQNRDDLVKISNSISVVIREDGGSFYLWFYRTEDSWDNTAIRAALGLEKGFAETGGSEIASPVTAQDALKAKLAEIRGKKV